MHQRTSSTDRQTDRQKDRQTERQTDTEKSEVFGNPSNFVLTYKSIGDSDQTVVDHLNINMHTTGRAEKIIKTIVIALF